MSIIGRIVNWLRPNRALDDLETRVVNIRADVFARRAREDRMPKTNPFNVHVTRMLIAASGTERQVVCATEVDIAAAAQRMSVRTRSCVAVCVIVGHYHVAGCEEQPTGGFQHLEN